MKRCKFLTLMLALLLLLQSSALATDKGKTVTVTLPTFAVTLNDTKIDSAHSEYPLIVYRDITYFPMTYHASRFLHLKSNWYQTEPKGTLFVGYSDASEDTWTDTPATSKNTVTAKATVASSLSRWMRNWPKFTFWTMKLNPVLISTSFGQKP